MRASECTHVTPNQETATQIHRPSAGTSAECHGNLSRYSFHERTIARWYDRHFDFVSLNKAAITQVIPPEHQQALVIDASFIPKSGTHTYGLERFWKAATGAVDALCGLIDRFSLRVVCDHHLKHSYVKLLQT